MPPLHLDRFFDKHLDRNRDLVLAMIATRVLEPASKLATSRALHPDTLSSTLGESLHLDLAGGSLVLYDLTSTYFEGRRRPRHDHQRASAGESQTCIRDRMDTTI